MKPLKVIGLWIIFNESRIRISSITTYRKVGNVVDIIVNSWSFNETLENEDQAAYRLNELDIAITGHGNVDKS